MRAMDDFLTIDTSPLFILLLQWAPSLLIPLPQEDNSTLDDLATLDPNGDENLENVSTNVKKSTVSLENETEPAIDHDAIKNDSPVVTDEDLNQPKADILSFRSLVPLIKLKDNIPIPIIFRRQDLDLAQDILKGGFISQTDNLPIDGLVGNAFNFIRRLKRESEQTEKEIEDCNSLNASENCEPKTLKKIKIDLSSGDAKKAIEDLLNINKLNSTNDGASQSMISCPTTVLLKIVSKEILDQLADNDSVVPKNVRGILNSIAKGNEDTFEELLTSIPIKVKTDLQGGDTTNILNELSNYVDTSLCSLASKRAYCSPNGKQSLPPMATRNTRGITSAFPAFWGLGIEGLLTHTTQALFHVGFL
uniref:SFRICE_008058 n=1 Tax=Spodoptera frugiperda TaxID=7108 RepID=A0A2H1VUD3_SPOFR